MHKYSGFRVAFLGFGIAAVGVVSGFIGFSVDRKWVSLVAFVITVLGIVVGLIGILCGWIARGGSALRGGTPSAIELAARIKRLWK